ncbi:MAG: aminotransferase class V-fold PLP-dependent enzyme [Chloroflexota bacterium]
MLDSALSVTASGSVATLQPPPFDAARIRQDFPILDQRDDRGNPLVYLDSASSSQKPLAVLQAVDQHYRTANANIHRGRYALSDLATSKYERAREQVAALINAASPRSCIFVRNTTEAINLVVHSWGRSAIGPGDRIAVTTLDHHSNLVPWQLLAAEKGATILHVGITPDGRLDLDDLDRVLAREPKALCFPMTSNSVGSVTDAREVIRRAHAAGAVTVVDGAQAVPHQPVDVQDLGCDFLACSGHKMAAPMGSGILYGALPLLEAMPPFMAGGGMVRLVTPGGSTFADVPERFEAGTPAVAEAIGLGAAADSLRAVGLDAIHAHTASLAESLRGRLSEIPGVRIHGPADPAFRSGIVAFTLDGLDPVAVAAALDDDFIAVRAGRHCCHPLFDALGLDGVIRASFYLYNTQDDADRLAGAIARIAAANRQDLRRGASDAANPCGRPVYLDA